MHTGRKNKQHDNKNQSSMNINKIICAICYEDAKPACEDLQSISVCGHVFHELCLQQWLEYCPRGKKPTCPVCKQHYSGKDVHRLFFGSAAELTQSKSTQRSNSHEDVEALEATVQKLEGQLSVTKTALTVHQDQLKDLNGQILFYAARVEKAESAQAEANREKANFREALSRIQEELKRSTAERCKLLDKNTTMAKELAAHKLVQNLDLNDDDVMRLASVGRGANKDDIIGTLTRSLILRNRTYKELMARCNELGMGESRALRKSEKATEHLRRLKARVQELEKSLEEKENGVLRSLKARSCSCRKEIDAASKQCRSGSDLGISDKSNVYSKPSAFLPTLSTTSKSSRWVNSQYHQDPELEQGLNVLKDSDPSEEEPIRDPHKVGEAEISWNVGFFEMLEKEDGMQTLACAESDLEKESGFENSRQENCTQGLEPTNAVVYEASFHTHLESVEQDVDGCTELPEDAEGGQAQPIDVDEVDACIDHGKGESLVSGLAMFEEKLSVDTLGDGSFPLHIRKEMGLSEAQPTELNRTATGNFGHTITRNFEGKWCKKTMYNTKNGLPSSVQYGGSSSGSFIRLGADGRGGQVKVLKPPRPILKVGGSSSQSWQRPIKRCKMAQSGRQSGNQQGALQIEHFFGGSTA